MMSTFQTVIAYLRAYDGLSARTIAYETGSLLFDTRTLVIATCVA